MKSQATSTCDPIRILFIAIESGRWGPCRLPEPLTKAGLHVAALCPADNALAHTSFVEKRFYLNKTRSSERFEKRLAKAMDEWRPTLLLPSDERTVVCLQALARSASRGSMRWLKADQIAVILASLCRPEMFDAAVLKTQTLGLARALGVRSPRSRTVATRAQALAAARELGYPVHLKTSFSWAGLGVVACRNTEELAVAAGRALRNKPLNGLKSRLRAWLHRDWYPTNTAIDVQETIQGSGAAFNAVALNGRLLAGFATFKARTAYDAGPSTVVRICANNEMAEASKGMIEAMGSTGFLSFDFVVEAATGTAYLIECNPRPPQVGHLGSEVGIDLCAAFANALSGKVEGPMLVPDLERTVGLYPLEWFRDPDGNEATYDILDRPAHDPILLDYIASWAPALESGR